MQKSAKDEAKSMFITMVLGDVKTRQNAGTIEIVLAKKLDLPAIHPSRARPFNEIGYPQSLDGHSGKFHAEMNETHC